jgi:hypothetical protein
VDAGAEVGVMLSSGAPLDIVGEGVTAAVGMMISGIVSAGWLAPKRPQSIAPTAVRQDTTTTRRETFGTAFPVSW